MLESVGAHLEGLKAFHLLWIIVVVPCFIAFRSTIKWAVGKVVEDYKKQILADVKELLISPDGQKILGDSFNLNIVSTHEKLDDVKKDVGKVAITLEKFTNNYYSRLEDLVRGLSGGNQ